MVSSQAWNITFSSICLQPWKTKVQHRKTRWIILLPSLVDMEISSELIFKKKQTIQYFPNRVTTNFIYKQRSL